MTRHFRPRDMRGIIGVRADAGAGDDPKKVIADLNKAFDAFKAEHTEQIAEVKKGFDDVVKAEKVAKIDADIGSLTKTLDQLNASVAALQVGAGGGTQTDPAVAEHAKAFDGFFRKGAEANLQELEVKASLSSGSDPDGGYTVPTEMQESIDRVLGTVSTVRSLAQVRSISAASFKKLVNKAGTTSGWVGETGSRTETDTPKLSALEFPAMELYAMPAATQTLLDDSFVNIGEWLGSEVSIEFAEQEGDAFVNGDGVNKPRGLLGYDTVANASYAWGKVGFIATGVAGALSDGSNNGVDALINLVYSLKAGYRQNGRFLTNDLTVAELRKFKDGDGRYLWQPPVQAGQPSTLLGYPLSTDDNLPDVGANAFPVAFADFMRAYLIVDRIGVRVLRDPFTAKPYVMFYTTKRVGGGIQNFEAIKLLKVST